MRSTGDGSLKGRAVTALTIDSVLPFLLERQLVSTGDIVRGDLEIRDTSRRNRNFRVKRRHSPSYLVKQADPGEVGSAITIATEARYYDLCNGDARFQRVLELLPRRIEFIPERSLLVLELLDGALPLSEYYATLDSGAFPPPIAALLGDALAAIHRAFGDAALGGSPPWVLALHRPVPEMLERLSGAHWQMLRIVQETESIGASLEALAREWRPTTLIHADLKADNILVTPGPEPRVHIVDWELAQPGDAAWDVGALFQDLLLFWIRSIPISPRSTPEKLAGEARFPLAQLLPAFRAFWDAYRRGAGLVGAAGASFLARAVSASGAHLLQRVYEQGGQADALSGRDVMMLQVATHILADPAVASLHVYGIPPMWILGDVGRS